MIVGPANPVADHLGAFVESLSMAYTLASASSFYSVILFLLGNPSSSNLQASRDHLAIADLQSLVLKHLMVFLCSIL